MTYLIEHIARELKAARGKKGLSQKELGAEVGMPQSHISKIEKGVVDLKTSSLIELARALDLELTLVSRTLVPVVKGLQRNRTARTHTPKAAESLAKNLEKTRKTVQRFARSFPDTIEFQKLTTTLRDLEVLRLTEAPAERARKTLEQINAPIQAIKSIQKHQDAIKEFQKTQDAFKNITRTQEFLRNTNQIDRALRDFESLRNALAHGLAPSAPVSLPAYHLDEEENDD